MHFNQLRALPVKLPRGSVILTEGGTMRQSLR
jgi:hypothetical protein